MTGFRFVSTRAYPAVFLAIAAFALVLAGPVSAPARADSLYGNYLAGRFAASLRENDRAAEFYRDALRDDPDNGVILERAFILELSAGNSPQAVQLARRIIKVDPKHRLARLLLGTEALKARQYAEARKHLETGSGSGAVGEFTGGLMLGWTEQGAGNLKAALAAVDVLKDADWYRIYRHYNSALMAALSGDTATARRNFEEAYKIDKTALRVVEGYARFLARNGNADKAREVMAAYEKESPAHPHVLAIREEMKGGKTPAPAVSSTAAGAAESLQQIGALLSREGGDEHAVVYFQLALHLDQASSLPLLSLADLYEQNRLYDQAAAAYGRVPEAAPMQTYAQIQRARNLAAAERNDEARAVLEKVSARHPDDVEAIKALGDLLRGQEKFAQAAEAYSRAIALTGEITKNDWTLLYYRGIAYERAKQWDKAEADLVRTLELQPEQPFVLNYLGYSWVDQGLHLDKAMAMIRKAVELRPDDGYIVDSLGWAHYRLGNFDKAVEELERAVELKPEDPVINDHLGDAYWRVGRKLEARFQWSHALDLKPAEEEIPKIAEKLKNGLEPTPQRAALEERQLAAATNGNMATDALPAGVAPGVETAQNDKPMADQPPTAGEKPMADDKPMTDDKPAMSDDKPMAEEKPAMAEEKPTASEKPMAEDKPAADEKPMAEEKPAMSDDKPMAEEKPAMAEEKPAMMAKDGQTYTVERGDSLWIISRKFYGQGRDYTRILEANRDTLKDARTLSIGQKLVIPAAR